MYYRDPDNNQVELLIDNFADVRNGKAYAVAWLCREPNRRHVRARYVVARFRAGSSAEELTRLA
jgi:hypothetical protein